MIKKLKILLKKGQNNLTKLNKDFIESINSIDCKDPDIAKVAETSCTDLGIMIHRDSCRDVLI